MSYDAAGNPAPEVAQSIESGDNVNYRIVLKPGWRFTDGSPVTAHSFVDAWNYGALSTNAQLQQSFFSPIDGYDALAAGQPQQTTMTGLRVVNDLEFTVRLKAPTVDFKLRLGHSAFYPLPQAAFRDMAAFGRHPIGNGPYQLADGPDGPAWEHNVRIDLRPNPDYHGNRKPRNKGLRFEFYANLDTAYADLLSGNLDVLDTIPPSALPVYRRDLADRVTTGPAAINQSLDTLLRLPHFGGEEGPAAPPGAVGGHQPGADLSADLRRHPQSGTRFHRPVAARLRPEHRRKRRIGLRPRAGPPALGAGRRDLGVERQLPHRLQRRCGTPGLGGRRRQRHQNVLGIDALGAPQPTFAGFRTQITNRSIGSAFRAGWQGDYPSMIEFFGPAVRHRRRVQRRRLFQPAVRRRAENRGGRARPAAGSSAGQRRAANSLPRHARCSAVELHQCGRMVGGGQPRDGHLERAARLREHRQGLTWVGTSHAGSPSWCPYFWGPPC